MYRCERWARDKLWLDEEYCIYIALATLPPVRMDGLLRTECLFLCIRVLTTYSNRAFGNTFILIKEDLFNQLLLMSPFHNLISE